MRIRLTPFGCDFLRVHWRICGDDHYFLPSCVMGGQFSAFLTAVYRLYEEENLQHTYWPRKLKDFKHEYPYSREDKMHLLISTVRWDEEGATHTITFSRHCTDCLPKKKEEADPIQVTIKSGGSIKEYAADGRDLCYAVARGCTEAIKKYGLAGYTASSGMQYLGDGFDVQELLFVKAYALGAMETRVLRKLWEQPAGWPKAYASSFKSELELLLFDM